MKKIFKKTFVLSCITVGSLFISGASFINTGGAKVQLLNKLTGKYSVVSLKLNNVYNFDDKMFIVLRKCEQSSKQDDPENIAFLQISRLVQKNSLEKKPINDLNNKITIPADLLNASYNNNIYNNIFIFSGFMYSSSPSLNILQDQIYDVTLISCL
jgi:hypothetical protein